jgi:hypothetical protein
MCSVVNLQALMLPTDGKADSRIKTCLTTHP